MSSSAIKTRNMAANTKTSESKSLAQSSHNTMSRYFKKATATEEQTMKQKTVPSPVKKTPRRKGRPHKRKSPTKETTDTEPDTEDNVSEQDVFSDPEQGENNVTMEPQYNTLADLETEVIDEIDPRTINITMESQPLLFLSLLRKIETLEHRQELMCDENEELKKAIEFNSNKISDMEVEMTEYKKALEETNKKLANVNTVNTKLREQGSKLREKTVKAESYSRRNYLRFEGIPEEQNETQNGCREKVYKILKNEFGIMDAERRIVIERCHRDKRYPTHNPPSILVRFLSFCDREEIWMKRDRLNRNQRNKLYLNQDFPPEVEKKRSFLRPYLKAAYATGRKAVLVGDMLIVDGNKYSTKDLENLPENMGPDKIAIQEKNEVILFYRSDAYLSNFYDSPLCIDNINYQNVEQFFTAEKARTFQDQATVNSIMEAESPSEMKYLGKHTKGFNLNIWNEKAASVMIKGLRAKFSQNQRLQEKLLNTNDKLLAESSKNDSVWGTGMAMTDPNAFNKDSWGGKNQLGNLLMKVREELRKSKN